MDESRGGADQEYELIAITASGDDDTQEEKTRWDRCVLFWPATAISVGDTAMGKK